MIISEIEQYNSQSDVFTFHENGSVPGTITNCACFLTGFFLCAGYSQCYIAAAEFSPVKLRKMYNSYTKLYFGACT